MLDSANNVCYIIHITNKTTEMEILNSIAETK